MSHAAVCLEVLASTPRHVGGYFFALHRFCNTLTSASWCHGPMAHRNTDERDYANGGSYRQQENYYTQEEAVVVDKAKRTHRETTQSAQRALKVELLTFLR